MPQNYVVQHVFCLNLATKIAQLTIFKQRNTGQLMV